MIEKIRLVTLDHLYQNRQDPQAWDYFRDMLQVRALGFGPDHAPYMLPYDMTDFFARHHLFYIKEQNQERCIGCFKHVSLKLCHLYQVPFPLLKLTEGTGSKPHLAAIHQAFSEADAKKQDVLYGGGFTIEKKARAIPGVSETIKELVAALCSLDLIELNSSSILGLGSVRFKTDHYFAAVGFHAMKDTHKKELPPMPLAYVAGDSVTWIKLETPSPWAEGCAIKHQAVLKNRRWIASSVLQAAA